MSVHRVIYRLDFEPNFDIIDSTGQILRLIKETGDGKYWPDLGEIPERHSVSGRNLSKEEGWWMSITIEPTALIGEFESLDGISVEQVEKSQFINKLFKITNALRKKFQIDTFKRIGFRLVLFEDTQADRAAVLTAFQAFIDEDLSGSLVETLGGYTDLGIALDGQHEDGLQYKLKCGPYAEGELKNYLPNIHRMNLGAERLAAKETDLTITLDIDLYEQNAHLSETTNFRKWCYPVLVKNRKTVDIVLQNLLDKTGVK